MTVTLSSAGGASVPNFTLLQTIAPTSGSASVTFSGLSGYSKYRLLSANTGSNAVPTSVNLQLNGDAVGNHYMTRKVWTGTTFTIAMVQSSTVMQMSTPGTNALGFYTFDVDHALMSAPKIISNGKMQTSTGFNEFDGMYQTTATLSSIAIIPAGTTFQTLGSIYLYGAN